MRFVYDTKLHTEEGWRDWRTTDGMWQGPRLAARAARPRAGLGGSPGHCAGAGRGGHQRELAELAGTGTHRRQHRDEPADRVGHRDQHCLEGGDAGVERVDADYLGRAHFPERRRRREHQPPVSRPQHRRDAVDAPSERRRPPGAEAKYVVTVAGHQWRAGLRHDRHRGADGVRRRRHRAVEPQHPDLVRPVRAELGLRLLAAAGRRRVVRAGHPRHADRRPLLSAADRPAHRGDHLARRATDRCAA